MKTVLSIVCMMVVMMSCTKKNVPTGDAQYIPTVMERVTLSSPTSAMLPNATAFRMSGDYQNNVGITLNQNGVITYFPAPTDITADSAPISLGNGWWLNCQGIGPNSVFTKYTFAEYAELSTIPSPEQLKKDVIPGARVTQFIELPMKLSEALNNIDAAKAAVVGY